MPNEAALGTGSSFGRRMKRINAYSPISSSAAPPPSSTSVFCHHGNSALCGASGVTFGVVLGFSAAGVDVAPGCSGLLAAGLVVAVELGAVVAGALGVVAGGGVVVAVAEAAGVVADVADVAAGVVAGVVGF